jgi:hypothetical protein
LAVYRLDLERLETRALRSTLGDTSEQKDSNEIVGQTQNE